MLLMTWYLYDLVDGGGCVGFGAEGCWCEVDRREKSLRSRK